MAALVQIMAWRRPGDKPLSEPMMGKFGAHICVARPQWVNYFQGTPTHQWFNTTPDNISLQKAVCLSLRQDNRYLHLAIRSRIPAPSTKLISSFAVYVKFVYLSTEKLFWVINLNAKLSTMSWVFIWGFPVLAIRGGTLLGPCQTLLNVVLFSMENVSACFWQIDMISIYLLIDLHPIYPGETCRAL